MRMLIPSLIIMISFCPVLAQTSADTTHLPPGDVPPPTVVERVASAGNADDYDDAPYVVVLDEMINRVDEQGVIYTDNQTVYKVLTDEGCLDLAVINKGYEPLTNTIEFREVNVIRGDSTISVPLDGVKDLPAPQYGIYWQDRLKMIQLPRLNIGDGVEVRTHRKGFSYALLKDEEKSDDEKYIPPMPGEYFDIVLFESTAPMIEKRYILKLPADKQLHSQSYNGPVYCSTTYDEDTTTYSWWVKDVEAWEPAPSRPDASDLLTKVVLATVESWEEKSRWFFDVNENQFAYTDDIKTKVDEIFEKASVTNGTEEQKAFELVHWVAQNIRYSGQTMGEGEGFTLHPGAMIFEQRSGVCKDIAGMLITMMRAAGMDSYAAMTMAGSRIETVPADQFNHCVVALKKSDGGFVMYDPTWVPFDNDIWSMFETEQHYLIGTPDGQFLSQIDYSPPEESPLHFASECSIDRDGNLKGHIVMKSDGAMDHYLRGLHSWFDRERREDYLLRMLANADNAVNLIGYRHGDPLDFHTPMWWEIDYEIPKYAMLVDGGLEFESPMMQMIRGARILFRGGSREWEEERTDDVFLYCTQYLDAVETVKLPSGYAVAEPPESEEVDETYAYYHGSSEMEGSTLKISHQAKVKRRQIPPDGYSGFRTAMNEARDYAETLFRAEKEGK